MAGLGTGQLGNDLWFLVSTGFYLLQSMRLGVGSIQSPLQRGKWAWCETVNSWSCLPAFVIMTWHLINHKEFLFIFWGSCCNNRLRWSRDSVLAFSTQVCRFKAGRSCRIFRAKKILSTPSFGGEVKPSVPCCRFAACKRSLNLRGSLNSGKITTGHLSRPQFHL